MAIYATRRIRIIMCPESSVKVIGLGHTQKGKYAKGCLPSSGACTDSSLTHIKVYCGTSGSKNIGRCAFGSASDCGVVNNRITMGIEQAAVPANAKRVERQELLRPRRVGWKRH